MLKNHSNEPDSIEYLVRSILNEKTVNDYMKIEIRGIERISEVKEYHGIRKKDTMLIKGWRRSNEQRDQYSAIKMEAAIYSGIGGYYEK